MSNTKKIAFERIIESINGNVQAQGIRIKFKNWMVMGSEEWNNTPDKIKAYAYQAALSTGWSDESLINAVCAVYEFIDKNRAKIIISLLSDMAKEYPLEVTKS